MSWDSAYSFGNPNAQTPTPTDTPTAAAFPSPNFQTPIQSTPIDTRSGWTPTFAEEYSVFNATPGRLIVHSIFADTPRPQSAGRQRLASTGDLAAELASHVHHLSPSLPPPISPADQLPSSVGTDFSSSRFNDAPTNKVAVTPQKPKKRLNEAFSGQTATPPHSASKGSRRLAPKLPAGTMERHGQSGEPGTPSHQRMVPFSSTSTDMFGYPMSASATAPLFNTRPFWDSDTSMSGMDIDFTRDSAAFTGTSHKPNNSNDWGRDNQVFQSTVNVQAALEGQLSKQPQSARRQRPLAPKSSASSNNQQRTLAPFDFNAPPADEDPFAVSTLGGAVDPGLLFSRPTSSTTDDSLGRGFEDVMMAPTRPATRQLILEPYQHQLRESRRDQEELHRSRSTRDNSTFHLNRSRRTVSSPIRPSGPPGLRRSMSENKGKKTSKQHALPASTTRDDHPPRTGRSSPLKQLQYISLSAIPESPDRRPRTEVKLVIDGNGKARTETVIVSPGPLKAEQRRSFAGHSDGWHSSSNESSSDDEPILIPNHNSSFVLPPHRNGPIRSRFEPSYNISDGRRSSASGSSYNQSESPREPTSRLDGHDSEAETVLDEEDGTGDATKELRKVMEGRKQTRIQQGRNAQHHHAYTSGSRTGPRYAYGSSTTSPAAVTDMDGLTPSSTRSGTTRCVCRNADGDGFMIQCESCDNWLHAQCVGIERRSLPPVYICAFCANTPNNLRGIRKAVRGSSSLAMSPLAHKSFRSFS